MRNRFSWLCFFMACVLLFYGCMPRDSQDDLTEFVISIEEDRISLAEMLSEVDVMTLSNAEVCQIASPMKVQNFDKFLFLDDVVAREFIAFDESGECLKRFESGEGPDQFRSFADFNYDSDRNVLEVLEHSGVLHTYDKSFNHISRQKLWLPDEIATYQKFARSLTGDLVCYQYGVVDMPLLHIFDGQTLEYRDAFVPNADRERLDNRLPVTLLTSIQGEEYFFNGQNNILHAVNDNFIPKMQIVFNGGNFDYEAFLENRKPGEMVTDYCIRNNIHHPIMGIAKDLKILFMMSGKGPITYFRTDSSGLSYNAVDEEDVSNFVLYYPSSEFVDSDGNLRFIGCMHNNEFDISLLTQLDGIDEEEKRMIETFKPGVDNPLVFIYSLKI